MFVKNMTWSVLLLLGQALLVPTYVKR